MMIEMGRPKIYKYPSNMTFDKDCGKFVVRNPAMNTKKTFAVQSEAEKAAKALNEWLENKRQLDALEAFRPTVSRLVDVWKSDKLQFMPWDDSYRQTMITRMDRIKREMGERVILTTNCLFLYDWLQSFCKTADQFNKWRYALDLLWRYAVFMTWANANEAEKIEERSTSKKLEANRKNRGPLDLEGYTAIHKKAPGFLQVAMEQSLISLQARLEICNLQHAHYRDGFIYVIRDKVSGVSDMAFIKIAMTEEFEEIRSRSRLLDDTVSPYIVHRKPDRKDRAQTNAKPHWTYVMPDFLTKTFAQVRNACGLYSHLPPNERTVFHEIRGLGSRLYEEKGMSKAAIQALMTHSDPKTTQIYLDGGAEALTDDDYRAVVAPLTLKELGIKG